VSAALESRYRAALRWYPRSWRAANADAIVGVMLDQAEAEGRVVPSRGELRDLAGSAIRTRIESVAPRAVRDRVAAVALAIGTAYALVMLIGAEWAPFATSGPANQWMLPDDGSSWREPSSVGFGPFASALVIVYALWIVAFVLVLLRLARAATALLLLTIPVLGWVRGVRLDDIAVLQPTTFVMILTALIAVLASVGRPARVGRAVLPLLVGVVVALALVVMTWGGRSPLYEGRLSPVGAASAILDAPGFALILLLAAIVLVIRRQRAWAVAALVSAAPWLVVTAMYFLPMVVAFAVGGVVALLVLAVAYRVWIRLSPIDSAAAAQ
jgi:hypothetical protein